MNSSEIILISSLNGLFTSTTITWRTLLYPLDPIHLQDTLVGDEFMLLKKYPQFDEIGHRSDRPDSDPFS